MEADALPVYMGKILPSVCLIGHSSTPHYTNRMGMYQTEKCPCAVHSTMDHCCSCRCIIQAYYNAISIIFAFKTIYHISYILSAEAKLSYVPCYVNGTYSFVWPQPTLCIMSATTCLDARAPSLPDIFIENTKSPRIGTHREYYQIIP